MYVIERRAGERIEIGDEVEIEILDTDGERVRLGVSAPRDIAVNAVASQASDTPLAAQSEPPVSRQSGDSADEG